MRHASGQLQRLPTLKKGQVYGDRSILELIPLTTRGISNTTTTLLTVSAPIFRSVFGAHFEQSRASLVNFLANHVSQWLQVAWMVP